MRRCRTAIPVKLAILPGGLGASRGRAHGMGVQLAACRFDRYRTIMSPAAASR
jgi:hypothetical protein